MKCRLNLDLRRPRQPGVARRLDAQPYGATDLAGEVEAMRLSAVPMPRLRIDWCTKFVEEVCGFFLKPISRSVGLAGITTTYPRED